MKLATAYVEIAARTDEFRRQLREVSQLSEQTGRDIARSLRMGERLEASGVGQTRDENEQRMNPETGRAEAPASPQWHRSGPSAPTFRPFRWPNESAASTSDAPGGRNDGAVLKQQLDLARKEIDILQKQLEVLKEIRRGVPAVLT